MSAGRRRRRGVAAAASSATSTDSRAAPVPTSVTGTPSVSSTNRRTRAPPRAARRARELLLPAGRASRRPAGSGGSRSGAPGTRPSRSRRAAHSGRRPAARRTTESTSSFVSASDVMPFTRTANRSATRSSQPQRRSRPVTVPNSLPELADALLVRPLDLARERPLADPRHVRLRDADDLVDPVRPDPEADGRPGRDRAGRRDERVRAVVEVEQRPLRALEEHALARLQGPMHEQRRVGDVRRAAARACRVRVGDTSSRSNGSRP